MKLNLYLEFPTNPQGKHANPLWKARSSGQSLTLLCLRSEDFIGILIIVEKTNSEWKSKHPRRWRNFCLRMFILQLHNHSFVLRKQKFSKMLFLQYLPSEKAHLSPWMHIGHILQMSILLEVLLDQISDFLSNHKFWKHLMAFAFMLCSTFGPPSSMNSHSTLAHFVNIPHRFSLLPHELGETFPIARFCFFLSKMDWICIYKYILQFLRSDWNVIFQRFQIDFWSSYQNIWWIKTTRRQQKNKKSCHADVWPQSAAVQQVWALLLLHSCSTRARRCFNMTGIRYVKK